MMANSTLTPTKRRRRQIPSKHAPLNGIKKRTSPRKHAVQTAAVSDDSVRPAAAALLPSPDSSNSTQAEAPSPQSPAAQPAGDQAGDRTPGTPRSIKVQKRRIPPQCHKQVASKPHKQLSRPRAIPTYAQPPTHLDDPFGPDSDSDSVPEAVLPASPHSERRHGERLSLAAELERAEASGSSTEDDRDGDGDGSVAAEPPTRTEAQQPSFLSSPPASPKPVPSTFGDSPATPASQANSWSTASSPSSIPSNRRTLSIAYRALKLTSSSIERENALLLQENASLRTELNTVRVELQAINRLFGSLGGGLGIDGVMEELFRLREQVADLEAENAGLKAQVWDVGAVKVDEDAERAETSGRGRKRRRLDDDEERE